MWSAAPPPSAGSRISPAPRLCDTTVPLPERVPHIRVHRTRRATFLYVDGSCASVWRRGSSVTGATWDLLAAPVALLPADRPPRVLLLGVGGGTVIRALRALRADADIVAVDLDDEVLDVARRAFDLDALGAHIVCGDAQRFLREWPRARRFDLVIDDIYEGCAEGMRKPPGWSDTLRRALARLSTGGLLICNALDTRDARALAAALPRPALMLEHRDYHNRFLLVGVGRPLAARAVARTLRAVPLLQHAMRRSRVSTAPTDRSLGGRASTVRRRTPRTPFLTP